MLNKKISIFVIFVVFTVVLPSTGCYRKSPEQRAEGIISNVAEKLDLNEGQKTKLNAIKDEFTARGPAMKKTREETFDQLIGMMRGPQIDQEKMKALVEKNKAKADELIGFISAKFIEFHDMLTPGQREKAAAEMERWREHYREHYRKGNQ
jgi:Spy/CpxP family protein refolding chaperone